MVKLYVVRSCTLVFATTLISISGFAQTKAAVSAALLTSTAPVAQSKESTTASGYRGYKEWKNQMIDQAQSRLDKIKVMMEQQRMVSGSKIDPNLRNQLAKEQLQVSISSELSITDYFVGYLNKQKDIGEAIKSTAGKLSPEEVAELMTAFAYNFNKQDSLRGQIGSDASQNRQSD